ncbi:hypothetical protein W97_08879 [Coniosporium apollinis CBS 100218]|uniref:Zn(2)-C6 fungal-type domain-containing protein n=1 Tax=Coniosporium apollinis (strain CBS 100218) TaxID=1168221 RepID=R7Z6K0_CONA1|nr:uncharacterized protein W97_08879 [Coniosporium apollinis CBS 100218]EON69619.1 hypothetical protein W97_08879 [Coniosporium apollinis CBS 100218]
MSDSTSTPSIGPKADSCVSAKHDGSIREAAAAIDDDAEDLPTIRRAKNPALPDPFLDAANRATSSPVSTASSPRSIWDSSPLRQDLKADSGNEWHSAPSSICSSPCTRPAPKPGTDSVFKDNKSDQPEEDLDISLERLAESCLQCQLKRLPCNRGRPTCSRCLRMNQKREPCLAQRRLAFREMRAGLGIAGFVVPIHGCEREGEEKLRAVVSFFTSRWHGLKPCADVAQVA